MKVITSFQKLVINMQSRLITEKSMLGKSSKLTNQKRILLFTNTVEREPIQLYFVYQNELIKCECYFET